MIVDTEQSKKSGPGTAMFSRTGKETITASTLYQKKEEDIPVELGGTKIARTFRANEKSVDKQKKRNFQPGVYQDANFLKKQLQQPGVRFGKEGKQGTLLLPGLEDELAQLEQIYPLIQQNAQNNQVNPKGVQPDDMESTFGRNQTGFAQTGLNPSATKNSKMTQSSKRLEKEQEPTGQPQIPKIERKIGQSLAFNAVDRNKMAINDLVYGVKDGPDMNAYAPNHELVKVSLTRNVSFQKEHFHEARTPIKIPPECVKDKTPCSIEKRKAINKILRSERQRSMSRSPSKSPRAHEDEYGERQGTSSVLNMTIKEEESTIPPTTQQNTVLSAMNDDIIRSNSNLRGVDYPQTQALLLKQIQQKVKQNIKGLDFKKLSGRHPNSIMQQQREAIPSEQRFEPVKGNMELLTKHRNTKNAPNLKMAPRNELFGKPSPQADYVMLNLDKVKGKGPGGQMDIGKRLAHASPEIKRNFVVPDPYDTERLRAAFNLTSNLKNNKALVTMNKSPVRDNLMYKFDEEYLNDLKRETRKKSFGMADYLPNSLRRKSEWATNSLSRNISKSRFNQSTYCDTSAMPQIRHASISELGSAAGGLSNLGRSINPSMSQLGMKVQQSKASLASGRSRSTTTSAFVLPPNVQQVSGSFLFFDEDKKRLSDLGQYKSSMRMQAAPELVNDIFQQNKAMNRIAPGIALRH